MLVLDRRRFLSYLGACLLTTKSGQAAPTPAYVTTAKTKEGRFEVFLLDQQRDILTSIPLPAIGHGACFNRKRQQAVLFARRPDRFALVLDIQEIKQPFLFTPPDNRHFFGHGTFSQNGKLLFATENDFEGERGVIGIYDTENTFKRLGEVSSGGIGPHEILLSQDGQTLIVANGGILTHPDYPRQKLNLPDMAPNIAVISTRSGQIERQFSLPSELHQVSLRHMALDRTGNLWIGGQYEGAVTDSVPLLFSLKKKANNLSTLPIDPETTSLFRQYIGSVAANRSGSLIAFSAPHGDRVLIWNRLTKKREQLIHEKDACGIATDGENFLISSGLGVLKSGANSRHSDIRWDNHILAL